MILRRIRAHVEAENWFAVFLDFAIVVVGVFIGIQVANLNASQQDRRDERQLLLDLHEQFLEADTLSEQRLSSRLDSIAAGGLAVNILFGNAPDRPLSDAECGSLSSETAYFGRADLPALERLQASGRIGLIEDRRLSAALARLSQRREAMELIRNDGWVRPIIHLYPELFPARSFTAPSAYRDDPERNIAVTCDVAAIRENRRALNDIAANADWLDAFLRDGLRPWAEQMQTVHAELDRVLGITHEKTMP